MYNTGATFSWDFGPSANFDSSNVLNPTGIVFDAAGLHTVTFTISQYGCNKSISIQAEVIVEPVAIIDPQTKFCIGHTVTFNQSSLNSTSYLWLFGDPANPSASSTLASPSHTYADTGVFQIMLVSFNQFCPDTTYGVVKVNELFAPAITVNQPSQCVDAQNFIFTVGGSFTTQALANWTFQDGTPSSANSNMVNGVTFPDQGIYDVTLQMNEFGCYRTLYDSVLVYPKPYPLFDVTPTEGCPPLQLSFVNKSFSATEATYLWEFGDGATSTEDNPSYSYNNPGTFDVTLTLETKTGCVAKLSLKKDEIAYVYPVPKAGFVFTPDETIVYSPVLFEDMSSNAISCSLFIDDLDTVFNCNMYYAFADSGAHKVVQWVKNEYGCVDSAEQFIHVNSDYAFYLPNAFTPTADGLNEIFKPYGFGISEFNMKIFDRLGQLIFESNDFEKGWNGKVNNALAQQDVYVYYIKITSDLGKYHKYYGTVTLLR